MRIGILGGAGNLVPRLHSQLRAKSFFTTCEKKLGVETGNEAMVQVLELSIASKNICTCQLYYPRTQASPHSFFHTFFFHSCNKSCLGSIMCRFKLLQQDYVTSHPGLPSPDLSRQLHVYTPILKSGCGRTKYEIGITHTTMCGHPHSVAPRIAQNSTSSQPEAPFLQLLSVRKE